MEEEIKAFTESKVITDQKEELSQQLTVFLALNQMDKIAVGFLLNPSFNDSMFDYHEDWFGLVINAILRKPYNFGCVSINRLNSDQINQVVKAIEETDILFNDSGLYALFILIKDCKFSLDTKGQNPDLAQVNNILENLKKAIRFRLEIIENLGLYGRQIDDQIELLNKYRILYILFENDPNLMFELCKLALTTSDYSSSQNIFKILQSYPNAAEKISQDPQFPALIERYIENQLGRLFHLHPSCFVGIIFSQMINPMVNEFCNGRFTDSQRQTPASLFRNSLINLWCNREMFTLESNVYDGEIAEFFLNPIIDILFEERKRIKAEKAKRKLEFI
jgi:hypothetical protein